MRRSRNRFLSMTPSYLCFLFFYGCSVPIELTSQARGIRGETYVQQILLFFAKHSTSFVHRVLSRNASNPRNPLRRPLPFPLSTTTTPAMLKTLVLPSYSPPTSPKDVISLLPPTLNRQTSLFSVLSAPLSHSHLDDHIYLRKDSAKIFAFGHGGIILSPARAESAIAEDGSSR